MDKSILILGACGQIGTELTMVLRQKYGNNVVVASDIREGSGTLMESGPFELLDATNYEAIEDVVMHYEIQEVYLGRHAQCYCGKVSHEGLELEHELIVQCPEPGKGQENR